MLLNQRHLPLHLTEVLLGLHPRSSILVIFSSSANEGARLNQKIKNKFGTREGVNFLSVYSVSPEAVGRWPGGYKATV